MLCLPVKVDSDRMDKYLAPLIQQFEASRNEKRAEGAKKYLKGQFEFLGLDAKTRRNIQREFIRDKGFPAPEKWEEFAMYLWKLPEREYQHAVIDILHKREKQLRKEDITWIEKLITKKSWWDTVDGLSTWICGAYFLKFPSEINTVTGRWSESNNIWLQRASLIFQLKYKTNTDTALLAAYIETLSSHKDFFIRKAIGWTLREYSKVNPEWVRNFVEIQPISGLSYREATKYI
jgi:3-methyladenine DNA glycosylase AlkD